VDFTCQNIRLSRDERARLDSFSRDIWSSLLRAIVLATQAIYSRNLNRFLGTPTKDRFLGTPTIDPLLNGGDRRDALVGGSAGLYLRPESGKRFSDRRNAPVSS